MEILVTGARGFIGQRLIPHLSEDHHVIAVVRNTAALSCGSNVSVIPIDLSRPFDLAALPPRIDAVVHLAQANVPFPESASELFAVNTGSTATLLDYARLAGARRFVLASSGDVYGIRAGQATESDAAEPGSFYAATKYSAELLAGSYRDHFRTSVLRLFHPYGPGQSQRLIPRLADTITNRRTIRLNKAGRPHLSPIYVTDVVEAVDRVLDSTITGVLNVSGNEVVTIRQLAERIGKVLDIEPVFEQTDEEAGDLAGDNRLMKQTLGDWQLIGLDEGIQRTFRRMEGV